jgi:hypothetical protein
VLSLIINVIPVVQNSWNIQVVSFNNFFQEIVCAAPCDLIEQWLVCMRTNIGSKTRKNSSNFASKGCLVAERFAGNNQGKSCGVEDVDAFNILLPQAIQLQLVPNFGKHFLFPSKPCFHQGNVKGLFQRMQNRNLGPGHTMIVITLRCPELIFDVFWWIIKLITEKSTLQYPSKVQ